MLLTNDELSKYFQMNEKLGNDIPILIRKFDNFKEFYNYTKRDYFIEQFKEIPQNKNLYIFTIYYSKLNNLFKYSVQYHQNHYDNEPNNIENILQYVNISNVLSEEEYRKLLDNIDLFFQYQYKESNVKHQIQHYNQSKV